MYDKNLSGLGNAKKVITVTLNPAIDLFISVNELTPGTLHRVNTPLQHAGGKGINVSKMLAALGVATSATGFLGGRRGRWLKESVVNFGIDAQFYEIQDETRINVKVTEKDGTLTEMNAPAPSIQDGEWNRFNQSLHHLADAGDWVALCGNLPSECPVDWYSDTIQWAKEAGLNTLLDASGKAFEVGLKAAPNVIKPNDVELGQLVGKKLESVDEVVTAAAELVQSGIKLVVVSMGGEGLVAVTAEDRFVVSVPRVPVVSSVGAGDTVVAGLLYGMIQGFSLQDTVSFASAAGTAKVQLPGTSHPTMDEIQKCRMEVRLREWRSLQ